MRVMVALWLGLLCAVFVACGDDDGPMLEGGETPLGVDPNDPTGSGPQDPGGPGIDPPQTAGMGAPGNASAGTGGAAEPTGMSGDTGSEMMPSDSDLTGGMMAAAGTGDGAAGTAGTTTGGQAGTGAQSDAGADDCGALPDCGVSTPCTDSNHHCIVLPSCDGMPKCLPAQDACMRECGEPNCALLESYPEQVGCGG